MVEQTAKTKAINGKENPFVFFFMKILREIKEYMHP